MELRHLNAEIKVLSTATRKGYMAKISIDNKTDKKDGKVQELHASLRTRLYECLAVILEDLGKAEEIIEVVKITPLWFKNSPCPVETNYIDIKIVIVSSRSTLARMEHNFQIFFDHGVGKISLLRHRFVHEFLSMLNSKKKELGELTSELDTTIADVIVHTPLLDQ